MYSKSGRCNILFYGNYKDFSIYVDENSLYKTVSKIVYKNKINNVYKIKIFYVKLPANSETTMINVTFVWCFRITIYCKIISKTEIDRNQYTDRKIEVI